MVHTSFVLAKEERVLPKAVLKRYLSERIKKDELEIGRKLKNNEKKKLAEDIEFELLPHAFCLQKYTPAIIDELQNRIIIQTSSSSQSSQFISHLKKAIPELNIVPLQFEMNLAEQFSNWIHYPETIPSSLQLANSCILFSTDDTGKRFHCHGYELDSDEINNLLEKGLKTAELSLIWQERIQFTLTQDFSFKKVKCTDYLLNELNETKNLEEELAQQDAAYTLLTVSCVYCLII